MKARVTIKKITVTRKKGRGAKQQGVKNGKITEVDAYEQELTLLQGQIQALDARIAFFENKWYRRVWRYMNKPIRIRRK